MRTAFCCFTYLILHFLQVLYAIEKMKPDIKARGGDVLRNWLIPGYIFGIPALITYLIFRPSGKLENCPECTRVFLHSIGKCPHCGKDVNMKVKTRGGKAQSKRTTTVRKSKEEKVRERWRKRELWVKTRPTSGDGLEKPEERIALEGSLKIKGGSLRRAKRSSGECPNCGRELYDWEDRCNRCGKNI